MGIAFLFLFPMSCPWKFDTPEFICLLMMQYTGSFVLMQRCKKTQKISYCSLSISVVLLLMTKTAAVAAP